MRRRQVKVVGNCQAAAVAGFYRSFVGAPAYEDVAYVDDLAKTPDDLRGEVADADIVIVQERDFKHGLSKAELGGKADVFTFPQILAGFLWPFANEPHPRNEAERPISDGPYPSQFGDSFLNRLIAKGVSPEDALDQYLSLDIAKAAHLDRMMELYLDRQRERDAATDFVLAPIVEQDFRTEKLFLTAEHPEARLFAAMASQLFEKMGVPGDVTTTAMQSLFRSPFPATELPLHPGVIAHFGLTFADAATTYPYLDEGRFDFREYVLRYMRFDNNAALRKAIFMVEREGPAQTLDRLDAALADSPRSPRGLRTRGLMLGRLGRTGEAVEAVRAGVEAEPANPDGHLELAQALSQAGEHAAAAAAALRAVEIAPTYGPAHLALAQVLFAAGDLEGGLGPAQEGLRLLPGQGHGYRLLGIALERAGHPREAESFARGGMLIEPAIPDHRNLVAELLEQQGRRTDAIALLEEGRRMGCQNDQSFSLLGNFWLRSDALEPAEEAFAAGAALYGHHRADLRECLVEVRRLRQAQA